QMSGSVMIAPRESPGGVRIVLLGATGQLGQEIVRLSSREFLPPALVLLPLTRSQLDMAHFERDSSVSSTRSLMASADIIVNCAAYTAVDRAEIEPELATAVNETGVRLLAQFAAAHDQLFIHISTDFVFGGELSRAYTETDMATPVNHYGRSKLGGERAIQEVAARWIILRSSWLFGSYGHNFMQTIRKGVLAQRPLRIVADQLGSPTPASDLARTVLQFCTMSAAGIPCSGLWHYGGTPAASWYGLARAIAETMLKSGEVERLPPIEPIASEDWPAAAIRPRNSVLDCHKIAAEFGIAPPDWRGRCL
ncbi:MAG: dTDP-4-dehydrorhamnose reductase, partial [Alphaproteobacteria bacterium]|nr:dTDP-4-dehydrorhamnose reductase [Alphaproteobacteria bacterium]